MTLFLLLLAMLPLSLPLPRVAGRTSHELVESLRRQLMQDNYDYMEGSDSAAVTLAPLNVDYAQPSRRRARTNHNPHPHPRRRRPQPQQHDSDLIPEPEEPQQSEFAPKEIPPRRPQQYASVSPRHGSDERADNRIEADGHSSAERPRHGRRPSVERGPPVDQRDLFYYADDTHFADTNVIDPTFVNTFDGNNERSRHKDRNHRDRKPHKERDVQYRRFGNPEDNRIDHDADENDQGHEEGRVNPGEGVQGQDHANSIEHHTGHINDDEYYRTSPRYKILEVPDKSGSGRRSGGGGTRKFLQEERPDGVSILKLGDGPFPEFRLPPDRRQYMPVEDAPVERRHRAPEPADPEPESTEDDRLPPGGLLPDTPLVPAGFPDLTPELPPLPPGVVPNDAPESEDGFDPPDTALDSRRLADLLGDDLLNMV